MGRCGFCLEDMGHERPIACPRCAAPYHPDCWAANERRCAVYACEPARPPERPPFLHPVFVDPAPRTLRMGWVVFAVLMATQLPRLLAPLSSPPRPPAPQPFFTWRASDFIKRAEAFALPLIQTPELPEDPELRAAWRARADEAIRLFEDAREVLPADPGGGQNRTFEIQHLHIELRLSELRKVRDRL